MGPDSAYERAVPDIDRYMERSFKTICMDYVVLNYKYSFVGKLRRHFGFCRHVQTEGSAHE